MREREKERGRNRTGVAWLGREETRRLVYSGDLDANERFEALFDIRHDFIKHSSNVQTLYIELYSRSFPVAAPGRRFIPRPALPFGEHRPPRVSLPPKTYRVLLRGGTAYNENNVPGELVIPQYRIMYNYIAGRQGGRGVRGGGDGKRNRWEPRVRRRRGGGPSISWCSEA